MSEKVVSVFALKAKKAFGIAQAEATLLRKQRQEAELRMMMEIREIARIQKALDAVYSKADQVLTSLASNIDTQSALARLRKKSELEGLQRRKLTDMAVNTIAKHFGS